MKLCMESVYDVRSQKSLRLTRWSLFLGILLTGMGLHRKKKFFFFKSINIYILLESFLKTEQVLIKELDLKME